mmetsp:Transcript_22660/g.67998  ORF Transcript_22660/g.67998 Transcript_22660/m.67998 type:complete len:128 (-) Transcript_22660:896-1279(-)
MLSLLFTASQRHRNAFFATEPHAKSSSLINPLECQQRRTPLSARELILSTSASATHGAARDLRTMPNFLDVAHRSGVVALIASTFFGMYTCFDGSRHLVRVRQREAQRMKEAGETPPPPPKHEKYFS